MQYIITFLEGMISFISPCMLPMIPLYITYFAGNAGNRKRAFLHALAFVSGFTITFTLLGVLAGSLGAFLIRYQKAVHVISGLIIVLFGLQILEVVQIPFFKGISRDIQINSIGSALVFGFIYSVNLTPCIGSFLGSALMMAQSSADSGKGAVLLLCYSAGLGIPFLLSALLIDQLKTTFQWIKAHYSIINRICGIFLILLGILVFSGQMNRFVSLLS